LLTLDHPWPPLMDGRMEFITQPIFSISKNLIKGGISGRIVKAKVRKGTKLGHQKRARARKRVRAQSNLLVWLNPFTPICSKKDAFLSKLFKIKVIKGTKLGHQQKFQPNQTARAGTRSLKTCVCDPFLIKRGIFEQTV
jgi:hypothetical protein